MTDDEDDDDEEYKVECQEFLLLIGLYYCAMV